VPQRFRRGDGRAFGVSMIHPRTDWSFVDPSYRTVVRVARICAVCASLLLLLACEPATFFVTDPFAETIVQHADEERREIERLLNDAPQPEEYLRIGLDEDAVGKIRDAVEANSPELVFLTPYLADATFILAPRYVQTQFVLLGESRGETGRENSDANGAEANIGTIRFDRSVAMAEAGRVAADYLLRQDAGRTLLFLAVVDTAQRRREAEAFAKSFRELANAPSLNGDSGTARPSIDEVLYDELPSRDELRTRLRDAQEEYGAVAVFLGRRSPYVIEQVHSTNLPYGSENLGLFDPLRSRMLFSVETRFSDALRAYLESQQPKAATIEAEARMISGPAAQGGETSGETSN
jgi:hypothetical protein